MAVEKMSDAGRSAEAPVPCRPLLSEPSSRLVDERDIPCCLGSDLQLDLGSLHCLIRPLVKELVEEQKEVERLSTLDAVEVALGKLRTVVEKKADAAKLEELNQQHIQILEFLADQHTESPTLDVQAILGGLQEELAEKADASALHELADEVERTRQLAREKADLSYVNRTNAALTKLKDATAQTEKLAQQTATSLEKMESHQLPQQLQRLRDMITNTGNSVKALQNAGVSAERRNRKEQDFDVAIAAERKEREEGLKTKATQQSVLELDSVIREVSCQLALKLDVPVFDASHSDLHHAVQRISHRVEQQELNATSLPVQLLQQGLCQKADIRELDETRSRLAKVEANVNRIDQQAADRDGEVREALALQREAEIVDKKMSVAPAIEAPRQASRRNTAVDLRRLAMTSEIGFHIEPDTTTDFPSVGSGVEPTRNEAPAMHHSQSAGPLRGTTPTRIPAARIGARTPPRNCAQALTPPRSPLRALTPPRGFGPNSSPSLGRGLVRSGASTPPRFK